MRPWLLVILAGLLGGLMYPSVILGHKLPDFGFFAWVHLIPLFILCEERKKCFGYLFLSSVITHAISVYWFALAMTEFGGMDLFSASAVMLLVLFVLGTLTSLALIVGFWIKRRLNLPFFVVLPITLLACDFLKTYIPVGGFPWILPAYSQGSYLGFFPWVDITGSHGLSWLIYAVNALGAEILLHIKPGNRDRLINRIVILGILLAVYFVATIFHRNEDLLKKGDASRLALIQGNIAQEIKWSEHLARRHLGRYIELTEKAGISGADLVIWPETAHPFTLNLDEYSVNEPLSKVANPTHVLFGVVTVEGSLSPEPLLHNSAVLMDPQTQLQSVYHKRHLVPFGEYIPMKKWLTFARALTVQVGDFSPGSSHDPIAFRSLKMGMLICFEDIFPELARESVLAGSNVLVNLTNDAWYGNSSAQYQHVVFSQMRALENRRYVVRSTNTGITALIDPSGNILRSLNPFDENILIANVYPVDHITFYSKYGDWPARTSFALVIIFCMTGLLLSFKEKRST